MYQNDADDNTHAFLYQDSTGSLTGSGVAIIVSASLNAHVFKTFRFKGRILFLDLRFKHKKHLRLITAYLPSNPFKDKDLIIELYSQLDLLINEAMKNKYKVILMGDFNVDFDASKTNKSKYPKWRLSIKATLKTYHLSDTMKYFHTNPATTWANSQSATHINYIFVSTEVLEHIFIVILIVYKIRFSTRTINL